MEDTKLYAKAPENIGIEDCFFYHTMDIPGIGLVEGQWDLRGGESTYLGDCPFEGKRVLEMGKASGALTFFMEKNGADVVAYDLSGDDDWDVVPFAGMEASRTAQRRREHIVRMNNGFWLAHRALGSKSRMVCGSVYEVPEAIGPVDVTTFGSILLHVRDPFKALERGLRLTRSTAIVTEPISRFRLPRFLHFRLPGAKLRKLQRPRMKFLPDYKNEWPADTWWRLPPDLIRHFLGVLGFEQSRVVFHHQLFNGKKSPLFTILAHRVKGSAFNASRHGIIPRNPSVHRASPGAFLSESRRQVP